MHAQPIIVRQIALTNSGTAVYINLEQVKPGTFWRVNHYSLYNESGESVTTQAGIQTLDGFVGIDFANTVTDGEAFTPYMAGFYIREGEKFSMSVKGSAKTGKVTLVLSADLLTDEPELVAIFRPLPAGQ